MPEICGDAVEYFNPEDSEELADKIKSLSFDTEKRTSLIEKGYERVRKFTWTNSAENHLEILKSLAKRGAAYKCLKETAKTCHACH